MSKNEKNNNGLVLSIERCSLHDGPGIRTTVFLKGCPLACAWCHNPESQLPEPELQLPGSTCTLCGECARVCPNGAHTIDGARLLHTLDKSRCTLCGACVSACPVATLKIAGTRMSVAEVLAEIEKDSIYYNESGGGVTLSGGEPLFQYEFTTEILRECKARGIHTCVETSGFMSEERFRAVQPLVDLFLFDYKATGVETHRALTGVDTTAILRNLTILRDTAAPVILRCPLIPGVNDSPEHLHAIANLAQTHSNVQAVELMAYHDFARDKFRRIGREYAYPDISTAEEQVTAGWFAAIRAAGYEGVRLG